MSPEARSRRPIEEPFVKQLHGLAIADDLVWVATTTESGGLRGCPSRSELVGVDRGSLTRVRAWSLTGAYRCALDVTTVPGVDGLVVLARQAIGDGPDLECTPDGGRSHRGGAWAALVVDPRTGRVQTTVALDMPCARRVFVAPGAEPGRALVALVDTTTIEEQSLASAELFEVDLVRGIASAPLALGAAGNAQRAFDLAALVPIDARRWLAYERVGGQVRDVLFGAFGPSSDAAQPWRVNVVGRRPPAALVELGDGALLGLAAGNRADSGLVLAVRIGDGRYPARWYGSSRANADAVAAIDDWPRGSGALAVATVERDGARAATLDLVDRPSTELRLRRRPEQLRLGAGAVGPRMVIDADGALFLALTWDARIVRVAAPR
jgi:hypothetical protein